MIRYLDPADVFGTFHGKTIEYVELEVNGAAWTALLLCTVDGRQIRITPHYTRDGDSLRIEADRSSGRPQSICPRP